MNTSNSLPFSIRHRDRIVGLFISGAIVLMIGGVLLVKMETRQLQEGFVYHSSLSKTYGITVESPIKLSGITIGKVESVTLRNDGAIQIDFYIFSKYSSFLTKGGHMEITGSMGLGDIFGGTSLEYSFDSKSQEVLPKGSYVEIIAPPELGEFLKKLDPEKKAQTIQSILDNVDNISQDVETVTAKFRKEQGALFKTLDNVETITKNVADATGQLPQFLNQLNQSVETLDSVVHTVKNMLGDLETDVTAISGDARKAMAQLSLSLDDVSLILNHVLNVLGNVEKGSHNIPVIISNGRDLLQNIEEITDKLNNHWLLGGKSTPSHGVIPSIHMDETLYTEPLP